MNRNRSQEECVRDWAEHCSNIAKHFKNPTNCEPDWCAPFAPWCGQKYWKDADPKILLVGKSVSVGNTPDDDFWRNTLSKWRESGSPEPVHATRDYMDKLGKMKLAN